MTSADRARAFVRRYWTHFPDLAARDAVNREIHAHNEDPMVVAQLDLAALLGPEINAAVAEALPRWVPVTERLPEAGVYVLVSAVDSDGLTDICVSVYLSGAWWCSRVGYTVLAWQPLPAPWVAP